MTDEIRLELEIDASPARVWTALTDGIGEWWPAEFYSGGEDGHRTTSLDPSPGGLMKEIWEGGGGLVWGTVVAVEPEKKLQIQGTTFPDWGGPNVWFGTWSLEAIDGGTRLGFTESAIGKSAASQKLAGWEFLMGALRHHVHGTPCPAFGE